MKKLFASILLIAAFSAGAAYSQEAVTLDRAILEIADYFDKRLPPRTTLAVLHIQSDNQALSNYIINDLVNAFIDLGNHIPVDRENIESIRQEQAFHLSGDVSDETAQAIGKMLGAQTIVTGAIFPMNNRMHRLEVRAISVETAVIQGTINKNILNDRKFKAVTGHSEAFPVSIGGGVYIGGTFAAGTREEEGRENLSLNQSNYNCTYAITETIGRSAFDIGAFIFLDLKYATISFGVFNGSGKTQWSWNKDYYFNDYVANRLIHTENDAATGTFSVTMFNIGVLGKYPFYLNNITLFPALGVDYQLWLAYSENGKNVPGDLSANNAVWIKLGGGMDYHITSSLFIRTELLWGVKLPSKNESNDSFTWFTHSPSAHIGIGYTFSRR